MIAKGYKIDIGSRSRVFDKMNIDFLGKRKLAYGVSAVLLAIGLVSLIGRGLELGIDFKGGSEIALQFEQPIDITEIRDELGNIGLGNVEVKTFGDDSGILIRTELQDIPTEVIPNVIETINKSIEKHSPVLKEEKVGPKIGEELKTDAVIAIVLALLVILIYLGFRFKFGFALGAVTALFHDVLITLGIFSILYGIIPGLNLEISISVVAAFLTLVGYSINDTVVVFDRIREDIKIHKTANIEDIMNKAINKTMRRTIITSLTTLMVVAVLLFFGGEVLRGFAFTLFFGIIIGTYSSIFVASSFVLEYAKKRGERIQF
ncbi:unnamed protein product [Cyprideis torosa]|uniref:Protein translocase subunit SecF n=1 Tax=Cyprideis torosa TaxID=163714 RepID=A0A7R8WQV5_9CRUS|nr:unnamed protein product [Cyprideis torosa]CAG0907008.1 unnamed protein product [Cyprideis torosa]